MRRSAISWGVCVLVLVIAASASAQKVIVDYDHKAPFPDYRTYKWIRPPRTPDPLMAQRLADAINAQLASKGWQMVSGGPADVGIAAHGANHQARTLERFYSGYPGWGWRWGPGVVTTSVQSYPVGTLVVDMFDGHSRQIVWRGVSRDTLSDKPDKNTKKLNKAVEKMFRNFPPR
jgi:hypothetical protein